MFKHQHPYKPYIPETATKLIVGTLPPPRFTTGELKPGDVDFCYGSRDGQLWQIIDKIFELDLDFENTAKAIQQREDFLHRQRIGICDMVEVAYREKIDASDIGMQKAELRPLIPILKEHKSIQTLLFTGGNSKKGPEYFFRKHVKNYPEIKLKTVNQSVPRIYQFQLEENRIIKTVSLTAPSGAANRAVGSMALYKTLKKQNPKINTIDFRVLQYEPYFKNY
ncbi:uracil-DNA glycosylase family protein [Haloflavibacter putidus]|uniref:Uracil-DNA glycosylase family protein n=1 Tax=Haloflavibacter putidus TaxID=2576776 RepID=A0A507ZD73_9FLAO|nr:uracil-DNA glycosylase family protein [Haloflavibacter putidus]TQD34014.1 uracil-DNA glycosylase family protein [Haloflavibacter putidus]